MKIGLYSITYLGIWYKGGGLSMREFIMQAKRLGYDGIEIDGKRPHGNPMDLDSKARQEIRAIATGEGIEIPCVASNNDFSSPIPEHRECQLLMVSEQIKLAADLGARVVRLFCAWPGVTVRTSGLASYDVARRRYEEIWRDTTRVEAWGYVREACREAAHIAESEGIILALQNHAPIIRHYQDVLDMVAQVGSPAFRACMDVPLCVRQDDEWVRKVAMATGKMQAHTHYNGEFERDANGKVVLKRHWPQPTRPPVNYPAFLRALKDVGYDGYFCYEFCHPAVNALYEPQGRDYVDEQSGLALEYMRELMVQEDTYRQ